MIWTSKCRMPRTRLPASRTTANASGKSSSSVSPVGQAAAELVGLGRELDLGERRDRRLERVDALGGPAQTGNLAFVPVEQRLQKGHTML